MPGESAALSADVTKPVQAVERSQLYGWDPPRCLDQHLTQLLSDPPLPPPPQQRAPVSAGRGSREPEIDNQGSLLREEGEN